VPTLGRCNFPRSNFYVYILNKAEISKVDDSSQHESSIVHYLAVPNNTVRSRGSRMMQRGMNMDRIYSCTKDKAIQIYRQGSC
jgi:hypothetical protein